LAALRLALPAVSAPIQHISDTARWVALYRAMESDRRDALFRDPYARRLAGERAERILAGMKRGRAWAWPMIVSAAVLDELILWPAPRPGSRSGGRARRRSRRPSVVPLVAVGHRRAWAAQDAGKDLGPRGGGGQRPVPVRARRGHGVLRPARVARSGVPLDVGGGAAPQADDAARVAVAADRPAVPEAQAGGGPAVCRDGDAGTVVSWARNDAEGRGRW